MGSRWKSYLTVSKQVSDQGLATAFTRWDIFALHFLVVCKQLLHHYSSHFARTIDLHYTCGRMFLISCQKQHLIVVRGKKCSITLDLEMFYIVEFKLFLVSIGLGEPFSVGCQIFYPEAFSGGGGCDPGIPMI